MVYMKEKYKSVFLMIFKYPRIEVIVCNVALCVYCNIGAYI